MNAQQLPDHPTHTTAYIKWTVDGPMLRCSDGTIHFLSLFERLMFAVGAYTIDSLNKTHNTAPRRA